MKNSLKQLITVPRRLTEKRPGLRWLGLAFVLLMGFGTVLAAEVVSFASPLLALRWCAAHPGPAAFSALVIAAVTGLVWCLCGSLLLGGVLTTAPCVILAFVNSYKLRIRMI